MISSRISARAGTDVTIRAPSQSVQAQAYSPRRAVTTQSEPSDPARSAAASAGPSRTCMIPETSSTWVISQPSGPAVEARPVALAAASLAHQNRVIHSVRLEADQRERRRCSAGENAVVSNPSGRSDDRLDVDSHAGGGIERGDGDGDGRRCGRSRRPHGGRRDRPEKRARAGRARRS